MATLKGTYIEEANTGNARVDTLVNRLIHPTIAEFQQIIINYENGTVVGNRAVRYTYQNWNAAYPVELYLNGSETTLASSQYTVDYDMGRLALNFNLEAGDSLMATYCFNYFPLHILEGFIDRAIVVLNTAGQTEVTSYTVEDIPEGYLGVVADIVISMCMEKLLLEYDLWKGRLVFAISNNGIYEGSDNIVGQLETVKRNAEERAYKSIDNEKLRNGSHLAKPTDRYYESLLSGSSARYKNGSVSYGPLRGARFNKIVGPRPRQ